MPFHRAVRPRGQLQNFHFGHALLPCDSRRASLVAFAVACVVRVARGRKRISAKNNEHHVFYLSPPPSPHPRFCPCFRFSVCLGELGGRHGDGSDGHGDRDHDVGNGDAGEDGNNPPTMVTDERGNLSPASRFSPSMLTTPTFSITRSTTEPETRQHSVLFGRRIASKLLLLVDPSTPSTPHTHPTHLSTNIRPTGERRRPWTNAARPPATASSRCATASAPCT